MVKLAIALARASARLPDAANSPTHGEVQSPECGKFYACTDSSCTDGDNGDDGEGKCIDDKCRGSSGNEDECTDEGKLTRSNDGTEAIAHCRQTNEMEEEEDDDDIEVRSRHPNLATGGHAKQR